MKIYECSIPLHSGVPVWPGDPAAEIYRNSRLSDGDLANSSRISSSLHWGTHLDAPFHIYDDAWTLDQIPAELLIGKVRVLEFPETAEITGDHLRRKPLEGIERIFFKTRNSKFWREHPLKFHPEFTALSGDAAELLLSSKIRLIGIDYLSIDRLAAKDLPVHRILYRENVVGLEGLDLTGVPEGDYQMICLPLNVRKGDGAPARVWLSPEFSF